ncbi:MAG: sterol desaturase family protein, partial [Sphingobacteriaceae bacterium]|nr:sterol desaturase family protein [Cytophagaceae bacterium]
MKIWLHRVAQWSVFPFLLGGGIVAARELMRAGVAVPLAVFGVLVLVSGLIHLLERALPYRSEWNRPDADVRTDLFHMVLAQMLMPRLLGPFWVALLSGATGWLSERSGFILWPQHWNLYAQLALALVIAEFFSYWLHRWEHEHPALWRFHAIHHSPNRLWWLNSGRSHPLEKAVMMLPEVLPFILLGAGREVTALFFVANGIIGLLQHCNINLRLGWLNYVFSLAEPHRWHHAREIAQSNTNYGSNLSVWDVVFGTFYLPKNKEVGALGVFNPEYPKTYSAQL